MKYDKNGRFLKQVGSEKPGSEPSQFNTPHGIAVDAQGNVYVADRANHRMQVFDNNLERKAIYDNIGDSWTVCISPGPHQYLFTSNSNPNGNPPGSWDITGEIYKMELDGTILGKFGHAGKEFGGFQVVHMMDCRNPNEIIVAEIESWRVQKLMLKPPVREDCQRRRDRRSHETSFPDCFWPRILLAGIPAGAQSSVPEISFDSAADPLKLPGTTSIWAKRPAWRPTPRAIFSSTPAPAIRPSRSARRGRSRTAARGCSSSIKTGKFIREIGQDSYGFLVAQQVRVDPQDNIWVVDQMSSMVIKFDPNGQVQLLLGRKPESERLPAAAGPPLDAARELVALLPLAAADAADAADLRAPASRATFFSGPTDVAWDAAGNIYVADGYGNARIAKFDKNGKFIKSWGSSGTETGQFNTVHGIAIDAQGNVYVADSGNKRIQVFDGDGTSRRSSSNVGTPAAICITPGAHQYLYSSNSNPPDDIDVDGEIYKMELNGKIVGKFGKAGKLPKEFGTVNAIDCRSENELYVGEIGNWRVQKLTLR